MTHHIDSARPGRQLSLKMLGYILLVSSGITLLLTGWQLWADYDRDLHGIDERFRIIETTTLDPLTNSVWALNEEQIRLLLTGMLNLEAVAAVSLQTDQGRTYTYGTLPPAGEALVKQYALTWSNPGQSGERWALGTLTVHASLEGVYARLLDRAATILLGQALKTFVVSVFILAIVQQLLTRHLGTIADYARQLSLSTLDRPLALQRPRRADAAPDELDQVENAINYMRTTLLEDIGRRQAAELELQQSEARYRQLFETSTDGLAIFDLEGRLVAANQAYLAMIGHSLEEARRFTRQQSTPEHWQAREAEIIRDQVIAQSLSPLYEKELIHRDGHAFPVEVRTWSVRDARQQPQYLMSIVRDIGAEKQLAADRARLEEHMRETQRLETVGTLAGGIAHDFNNLLTPIRGYAEMIMRDAATDTTLKTRAEAIFHAAERGRKLVESILLFSRRGATHRVDTDVAQVVRETLALANPARPAGVQVNIAVQTRDASLRGDPTQLHQLLMNLVINAFHAMENGGELVVSIAERERPDALGRPVPGLELQVRDTGCGIAPENLPKIFEPFFTTRGLGRGGNGLGLSVVHGIVKAHAGDIAVQSSSAGTTFTVWLPRRADDEDGAAGNA